MIRKRNSLEAARPEAAAGGILRDDGEIHFYTRVNALLGPDMTVVDYGAGRGAVFDSGEFIYREALAKLQGKVRKVIGVDVDEGVLQHPYLDERHVIEVGGSIPVADRSVDLVMAHWVFEHVQDPEQLAGEFYRILRPGGWVCARTPHRWSYVGIATRLATRLLPDAIERTFYSITKRGLPLDAHDKFPTAYRMNSRSTLARLFPAEKWDDYSYGLNSTPRYFFGSRTVFEALNALQAIAWPKVDLIVLLRKK